jgi:hypothetical protein
MKRKQNIITTITSNFFLKKVTPLPSTMQLLKDLYPTVDWSRVNFYEGLPWFTPFIAPYVNAQALPHFYSFNRFSIYIRKFDESRIQCVSDIVHEAFHVLQGMKFWKGYGIGILRGFTIYYSAVYTKYGYRNNPFETSAYDQEFRFLDFCEKHHQHGIVPEADSRIFKDVGSEPSLIYRKFSYRYNENFFILIACFIVCVLLAIIKPLLDVVIYLFRFITLPNTEQQGIIP